MIKDHFFFPFTLENKYIPRKMNFIYIYIEKTDYDYTPRQAKVRNQEEAMGNPKPKKSKKIFKKK